MPTGDEALVSKEALIQSMVAALLSRKEDKRHGLDVIQLRKYVHAIYARSLDGDSHEMKLEIQKVIEGLVGGD